VIRELATTAAEATRATSATGDRKGGAGTVHDPADSQAALATPAWAQLDVSVFALLDSPLRVADA